MWFEVLGIKCVFDDVVVVVVGLKIDFVVEVVDDLYLVVGVVGGDVEVFFEDFFWVFLVDWEWWLCGWIIDDGEEYDVVFVVLELGGVVVEDLVLYVCGG